MPGVRVFASDPVARGRILLGELGCTACHDPQDADLAARFAPRLQGVGTRLTRSHLRAFLASPADSEPGTRMPNLLLGDAERRARSADALFAMLLEGAPEGAPDTEPDDEAAALRGKALFHEIGCVACHAPRDEHGIESDLPNSVPLGDLTAKYTAEGLRRFLLDPLAVRPAGRMPDLHLTPSEAYDLERFLRPRSNGGAPLEPPRPASELAREGATLFHELGCARCHGTIDDAFASEASDRTAPALSTLDPARGCLDPAADRAPRFVLSDQQRADLRAALAALDTERSTEQHLEETLAARNCVACHSRGDFGGIEPSRDSFFTTRDASIGAEARVPPPLTGVGAKLQTAWMIDEIAHGGGVRPYLVTRMPGFGEPFANWITHELAAQDLLAPLDLPNLPEGREEQEAVFEIGRTLVGDQGMNCIVCHTFAGENAGTMAALDLVDTTGQRLQREWFHHFVLRPMRFRPDTLMPRFFVDGESTRPEIGDGDPTQQIDAIWQYLSRDRNVRKPSGLRRPPIELTVDDEAVMLRRSLQGTGKRGIGVGLPAGVHYAFDAESLALQQIWWGRFLEVSSVFTGQGSGVSRPLGEPRFDLGKGPIFVRREAAQDHWPEVDRRALGQSFLGYDLDELRRPRFRYVCEDVEIEDAPVDVALPAGAAETAKATLHRTLHFSAATDTVLWMRVATGAVSLAEDDSTLRVGDRLEVAVHGARPFVRSRGEDAEALLEIEVPPRATPAGTKVVELDYRLSETPR